ncbi:MAG: DUF21 domain-containing protein [bacterium]|nr:MAG: DUF21 domain-containing protein [bacterium]
MVDVPTWEWVTIIVCVLLSGYFSGSETAFVSLSRAKVHALLERRGKKRDPLRIWLKKPSALLTAILIGNNLVNIGASALATDIASRMFRNRGIAVAVGATTLVILVFGEITPKVMARRYAERFVLSVAQTLAIFYLITWPATWFFTWFSHILIRLTGGDPDQEFSSIQADELELIVSLGAREGSIEQHPADIIGRVLKFEEKAIKDIMVPRMEMVALELSQDAQTIVETAVGSGHSRLPVFRDNMDDIVGVFHVKDLLLMTPGERELFRLAEHLHPPYFVPESAQVGGALKEFQRRRIHLALVVDEFGGTEGLVTLEDILEELVGEIHDEFDRDVVMMRRLPSGALEVSGRTLVSDLQRIFPAWKEEVPSKTVGGLIMELTGRVPEPGETIESFGLRFTVVRSDERRIKRIRVTAVPENGEGQQ